MGALGYFYRGRVLDACGLVSPEALPFLPVPADRRVHPTAGAISVAFVQSTEPEFVVTMPTFAARSLARSEWFDTHYRQIAAVPLPRPTWGSEEVLVFHRRP